MRGFLVKVAVNAAALWAATLLIPGVEVSGASMGRTVLALLAVGAIFGIVNTVIKPVVKLLTLPVYVLTLGLMAFVVNAAMLELVSWLAGKLNIPFHIDHFFWSALAAAVVVTLVSMVLNKVIPDGKD